jgi:hypothetical protein
VGVGGAFALATIGGCLGIVATRRIPRHVETDRSEPAAAMPGQ